MGPRRGPQRISKRPTIILPIAWGVAVEHDILARSASSWPRLEAYRFFDDIDRVREYFEWKAP